MKGSDVQRLFLLFRCKKYKVIDCRGSMTYIVCSFVFSKALFTSPCLVKEVEIKDPTMYVVNCFMVQC